MELFMKRLMLLLVPAALFAAQARYARLGEFDGKVEVQLTAADQWVPAERNLPLPESTWMRTGPSSKIEIELDEGSAWRLGPDSLAEISDYTRLSTGQRVTLLSLDHGVAYFTGEPEGRDSLVLAVPGAQITLSRGARVRFEAQDQWSQISVIEGTVRFSSPAVEMDVREGKTVRVQPSNPSRFFLYPEVTAIELDGWSEQRDQALASPPSSGHVTQRYGVLDLDSSGEWVQTEDLGAVWKPKQQDGFLPYQKGRWRWYDTLGYTWVSDETWGWLPYHYGRWTLRDGIGWVWAPGKSAVFKPGEVFWLRGARLAGWGLLAPGEQWTPLVQPRQFLNAIITYAIFQPESSLIDPVGFTARPKEPLAAAVFAVAMPSPTFVASRLDAVRPALRMGSTRVVPHLPGVTFQTNAPGIVDAPPPPISTAPEPPPPPIVSSGPPPEYPPPVPIEVIYPVPVYTGVIVVNPPEHPDYSRRGGNNRGGGNNNPSTKPTPTPTQTPASSTPAANPVPRTTDPTSSRREHPPISSQAPPPAGPIAPPPVPSQSAPPIPRVDPGQPRREHPPAPPVTAPTPAKIEVPKIEPKADPKPDAKTPDSKPAPRPTGDTSTAKQTQKQ
jgi:hypothetical protein